MAEQFKRIIGGIKRRTSRAWRYLTNKSLAENEQESPEEVGFTKLGGTIEDSDWSDIVEVPWDIIGEAQAAQAAGDRTDAVCEWCYCMEQATFRPELDGLHPNSGPVA